MTSSTFLSLCHSVTLSFRSGVAFQLKQGSFYMQAAAVASQFTVLGYNSVAGNDDRDGIAAAGLAHRSESSGLVNALGNVTIGSCLSKRDLAERSPNILLKCCTASNVEGKIRQGNPFGKVRENCSLGIVQ